MHVPRIETRTIDETVRAVDLGQTPADVVFLSFSDSDLKALAHAYDAFPEPRPTLRIASLAALRHPFSVDLYLERVCSRAKLVVARMLGGADYWRYGVDELSALARRSGVKLALLPGDRRRDARLDEASTLESGAALQIWRYFDEGGPENISACLAFFASQIGGAAGAPPAVSVSAFGRFDGACFEGEPDAARALIVFYRSIYLANDLEPIEALAQALSHKGFAVTSIFVTSLKDEVALERLRAFLAGRRFDVVLNATAFSARVDDGEGTALDALDAPVLQVVLAGVEPRRLAHLSTRAWAFGSRDACRAAGDRRTNPDARHLLQGGQRARRADRIRRCRASAARRPRRLRRRARSSLGESPAQSAVGQAPGLRAAGLSGARRTHRLCGRPRYAGERHRHLRDSARRGL